MVRRSEDDEEVEVAAASTRVRWLRWGGLAVAATSALLRIVLARGETPRAIATLLLGVGVLAWLAGEALHRTTRGATEPDGAAPDAPQEDLERPSEARSAPLRAVVVGSVVAIVAGLLTLAWAISSSASLGDVMVQEAILAQSTGLASSAESAALLERAHDASRVGWLLVVLGAVGAVSAVVGAVASAPATGAPRASGPPPPRRRNLVLAAFSVLLLAQAVAPLRYYLGDDRFDERFSWRMFSAVRVYQCQLSAFETRGGVERPTRLMSVVHEAWVNTLRRSREDAMERYLEWRCEEDPEVEAARLVNRCRTAEGDEVPVVDRRIECAVGDVVDGTAGARIEVGR